MTPHVITAYDAVTERRIGRWPVPEEHWPAVRELALVGPEDEYAVYSYPLSRPQAVGILRRIEAPCGAMAGCYYFLEPS